MPGFLYRQDEFLVIGILLAMLLTAIEFGFRRGYRIRPRIDQNARSEHSVLQGGVMGLMALLLAFTFSMSVTRFETRKQALIDEANAIGTAWSYAHLLPQPDSITAARSIGVYLAARIDCYDSVLYPPQFRAAKLRAQQLQHQLWSQAVALAARNPQPVPTGLYIGALNDLFSVGAKRDAARDNQVPQPVLFFLFLVAILTASLLGYGCGLSGYRSLWATSMVCVLISLAIMVIMDLDRPRRGLITISQQPMLQLRDSLRAETAPDAAQTRARTPLSR